MQTATAQEIGKAYKRKCLEWHPDKHGQDEESQNKAREMFNAIGEAQEILSDEKRRALYDEGCDKEVRGSSRARWACLVTHIDTFSIPEAPACALRRSIRNGAHNPSECSASLLCQSRSTLRVRRLTARAIACDA